MLKVFLGFMVSVVVLLSSAYAFWTAPRASATSVSVLITHIQAGGIGAPTQEFIVLYNNSADEVNVTGWCLTNKSGATIACLNPPMIGQTIYLPAYQHAIVVSQSLTSSAVTATTLYVPLSQSNGSITGSSDTISLVDSMNHVVDSQVWTSSISAGMQFERHGAGAPVVYADTDTAMDWSITVPSSLAIDETEINTTIADICPNIEGIQAVLPPGKEIAISGDCIARAVVVLTLSEILPNATGADDGNEFIELFNPNSKAISLSEYELYIGPHYENTYYFPADVTIEPGGYVSFTNAEIPFTLLNSSSQVRLTLRDGSIIGEVPAYTDPKDGQSWANIDDEWQYTNQPTPGSRNLAMDDSIIVPAVTPELIPQPCAVNQYRSTDTGRCRLTNNLVVASVIPCKDGYYRSEETNRCRVATSNVKKITPCGVGEERNLETNRCRKIAVAVTPVACKDGQERNPDTNRCRTITNMPNADYGVLGAETKGDGRWYVWATVGGVVLVALGYAVWEWHDELGKFFRKQYIYILRFARLRK
jgi:hypothetical protein